MLRVGSNQSSGLLGTQRCCCGGADFGCNLWPPSGTALPPRRLQIHDLSSRELLGHAAPVQAQLPHQRTGTAATLDAGGGLLLWQLQPLQPLIVLQAPG